jgi:hypothetical protein
LGRIAEGWGDAESETAIQVVRFADRPDAAVSTYATLGMSKHILPMNMERSVRQELLFSTYDSYTASHVASFLLTFAQYIVSKQRALLRGDVVGPSAPLVSGSRATGVYASMPVLFQDGLATFRESSPATVIVWLLPLLASEAEWIRTKGWEAFEDQIEQLDVDFFDLGRGPAVQLT